MKWARRILSLALVVLLMISALSFTAMAAPKYSDWFDTSYMELTNLELVPEAFKSMDLTKAISRAEMCELAVLALETITENVIEPARTDYFTDTTDENIIKAHELGIVNGYPDGTFLPNANLSRQEFFVIVQNFCQSAAFTPNTAGASLKTFPDRNTVGAWAKEAAEICVKYGYVSGSLESGQLLLKPKSTLSRQEAMTMLLRCFKGLSEYYYYVKNASVISLSGTGGATSYVGDVAVVDASGTMMVNTAKLNLRSIPSTSGSVLGTISRGVQVTVTGVCSNQWLRVQYGGKTGYLSSEYLMPVSGGGDVASDVAIAIANEAMTFLGYPYVWGAESPKDGFDCSGLVYYVFTKHGYSMYRVADDQMNQGVEVPMNELLAGDLVFFGYGDYADHVGIYIGNGNFVHAANPKSGVKVSALSETYYANKYLCAKRIAG